MEYLTKVKKVPYGEGGLFSTNGHYTKWYVAESRENIKYLKEFWESRVIGK